MSDERCTGSTQPSASNGSRHHEAHCSKLPSGMPRLRLVCRPQRQIVRTAPSSSFRRALIEVSKSSWKARCSGFSHLASSSTTRNRRAKSSEIRCTSTSRYGAGRTLPAETPFRWKPVSRSMPSTNGACTRRSRIASAKVGSPAKRPPILGRGRRDRIEAPLHCGVVKIVRQRPTDAGFARPAQARSGGGRANPETGGNLALGQAGGRQPQHVADLAHR